MDEVRARPLGAVALLVLGPTLVIIVPLHLYGVRLPGPIGWMLVAGVLAVVPGLALPFYRLLGPRRSGRQSSDAGSPAAVGLVHGGRWRVRPARTLWCTGWLLMSVGSIAWVWLLKIGPEGGELGIGLVLQPPVVVGSFLSSGYLTVGLLPTLAGGPEASFEAKREGVRGLWRASAVAPFVRLQALVLASVVAALVGAVAVPEFFAAVGVGIGPHAMVGTVGVVVAGHVALAWLVAAATRTPQVEQHAEQRSSDMVTALGSPEVVVTGTRLLVADSAVLWCALSWTAGAWSLGLSGGHPFVLAILAVLAQGPVVLSAIAAAWLLSFSARR